MTDAFLAIESLGEKTRHRSFPGSSRSAKKIGMGDFIVYNRVPEGADDRLLTGDFLERLRSVFVIESFIGHSTFNYTSPPPFFLVSNLRLGRGCMGWYNHSGESRYDYGRIDAQTPQRHESAI